MEKWEKWAGVPLVVKTQNGKMKQDCLGSAIKQPAEVNCFKVGQQAQPKGKENPDLLLLKKIIFTDAAGREEGKQGGAVKGGPIYL